MRLGRSEHMTAIVERRICSRGIVYFRNTASVAVAIHHRSVVVLKCLTALCAAVFSISIVWACHAGEPLASAPVIKAPSMPRPDYLQPVKDPVFHTPFTRITDPGPKTDSLVGCDRDYCKHRYSSAQAWNADQSLLLISHGCSGWCFLDGQTYKPLFRRRIPSGCEWHPTDPELMICVHANRILSWAPRANRIKTIWQSTTHLAFEFGPRKGNTSRDGSRIAIRARTADGKTCGICIRFYQHAKVFRYRSRHAVR